MDNSLVSTVDVLDSSESAVFDPTILPVSGAVQTIKDKNGAVSNISLTPLFNPRTRVSNGSYTINAWGIGWNVTYYINISSNKITSANNLDYIIAVSYTHLMMTVLIMPAVSWLIYSLKMRIKHYQVLERAN